MITILHGDNVDKSYARLIELKEKYRQDNLEQRELDAAKASITVWEDFLVANNMFSADFLVIHNFFSAKDKDFSQLENLEKQVILYEKKKLNKIPTGKNILAEKFDLDPILFKFVDSLIPGNSNTTIKLFEQALIDNAWELVFSMIVRQFRLMLYASLQNLPPDSEWVKVPDWQKGKLKAQASKFTLDNLKDAYPRLLEIDLMAKTSQPASVSLELFLLNL